ncbi:hypothetical protein [Pontibacter burrus]|uniref:SMODS-associating 2TM beta-strand rich effector domain-containing protein n=1 Tax=Pontibacter burrus TaxID=2704466 RepID=A0A6B3LMP8_9BACT|nr:hypothetical protein [Pontibacter burrus]NEM98202.1 hypothetical protein [Pontibacter burrus]
MPESFVSIFLGVFSGILTSIIIWAFVKLFRKVLIPWYQQIIYRGINISGEWTCSVDFPGGVHTDQMISLIQKGHKVQGTFITKTTAPNREGSTNSFRAIGEVFDNYVDIEYNIIDKRYIGRGSFMFKVLEGGEKLQGGLVAIDRISSNIITSESIEWTRKK